MKITITEALSEVNLIKKKITSQQASVLGMLWRPKHIKDIFESEGGTEALIKRNTQSLTDLSKRLEKIRGAIAAANLDNEITIGETTKTIFDWLTWKREASESQLKFTKQVYDSTKGELDRLSRSPQVYKDDEGKTHLLEVVPNIDLGEYLRKQEILTEVIEKLDGQLSLKNATILIDI